MEIEELTDKPRPATVLGCRSPVEASLKSGSRSPPVSRNQPSPKIAPSYLILGLGGPGHGLVFDIPFSPNLNSVLVSVSVNLTTVRFSLNFGLFD